MDPDAFQEFFVAGAAPESDRDRYRNYFYEMDPATIADGTATATVRILDPDGDVVDEQQWSFTKVDADWKISDAPLP